MGTAEVATRPTGTAVQRQEFGATELTVIPETAAMAVAAREKAAVEARYIMAMNRGRSIEKAREGIIAACRNQYFAESAWYKIPNRGEGFTIRFAEEALRCFGNVYPETMIVFENDAIRMIRVNVTDLEANLSYSSEVIIQKTVERKQLRKGQQSLGERVNSYGEKVYMVEATEDEITVKQNATLSKAIRTNGLRLIPSWIKEEAREAIFATIEGDIKNDFAGQRRKVIDAFGLIGITVAHLEQYFGKPMDQTTPADIVSTKPILTGLKDGEMTWDQVMEERQPAPGERHGSKQASQDVAEEKLRKIREQTEQQQGSENGPDGAQPGEPIDVPAGDAPKGQSRGFNFGGAKK